MAGAKAAKTNGSAKSRRLQILDTDHCKRETVNVPEWGGEIPIRELGSAEKWIFEKEVLEYNRREAAGGDGSTLDLDKLRIPMVRMGTMDPDDPSQPLFTADDDDALERQPARIIDLVFKAISKLSGLMPGDEAEAIKEARDFSEETPTGVSSSESPSIEDAAPSES